MKSTLERGLFVLALGSTLNIPITHHLVLIGGALLYTAYVSRKNRLKA